MAEVVPPNPKKPSIAKTLIPIVGSLVTGAGATFGILVWQPELIAKGGGKPAERKAEPVEKSVYYPLAQPFTTNLRGSPQFVQASLALSTRSGESAIEVFKTHETALRSAILMAMADQPAEAVSDSVGKLKLARLLAAAVNATLKDQAETVRVDKVYFTALVVQ